MGVAERLCESDGLVLDAETRSGVGVAALKFVTCLVGAGVRHADAIDEFRQFIEKYNFPFVSSYGGKDILPSHHLRCGILGTHGTQEAANQVRDSDTLIVLGCRLSVNTRGYSDEYVDGKRLIIVDIDPNEHADRLQELVQEDVKTWLSNRISG